MGNCFKDELVVMESLLQEIHNLMKQAEDRWTKSKIKVSSKFSKRQLNENSSQIPNNQFMVNDRQNASSCRNAKIEPSPWIPHFTFLTGKRKSLG